MTAQIDQYARIEDDKVVELFEFPKGTDVAAIFSSALRIERIPKGAMANVGDRFSDGKFTPSAPDNSGLADIKLSLASYVDALAGRERLRWISDAPGQDEVYAEKRRQAEAYLASEAPDPTDYPDLAAEVGLTGGTLEAVARAIVARSVAWSSARPLIERARLQGKKSVGAATSIAEAKAAMEALSWPPGPEA